MFGLAYLLFSRVWCITILGTALYFDEYETIKQTNLILLLHKKTSNFKCRNWRENSLVCSRYKIVNGMFICFKLDITLF